MEDKKKRHSVGRYAKLLYFCSRMTGGHTPNRENRPNPLLEQINTRMGEKLKKTVKLILFLALGAFFIWLSVKDLTPEQRDSILTDMKGVFTGYRWLFLVMGMVLGVISVYLRGLRSIILLEPMGYKVSRSNAYHSVMICYIANVAVPRLGELLRCTYLQRYEKVPFQKNLGTVITERIVDMLLLGLLFVVAIFAEADKLVPLFGLDHLGDKFAGFSFGKWIVFILVTAAAILLLVLIGRILKKTKFMQKIREVLLGFWQGIISITKLKRPGWFIAHSILIWICWYFMFMIGSFAFPEMRSLGNPIWAATLSSVVVGTFGFVIAQGGLGAYPLLVSQVLLLYGIPYETGLAIGWVIWANETFVYVAGGLITLIYTALRKSPQQNNEVATPDKTTE